MLGGFDQRLRHAVVQALLTNAPDAAPDLLHHAHAAEHVEQQAVARHARDADGLFAHPGRQSARRHDLQPVVEQVHLHVGRGAVVAVGDGVHQRLADRPFGQLQTLMPAVQVRNQRRVELGFRIRNAILVDRVEVARELLEIDDMVLGDAAQQRARHFGLAGCIG